MAKLDFTSGTKKVAPLLGFEDGDDIKVDLFKQTFSNPAGDVADELDNFFVKGKFQFDLEVGLELDLGETDLGDLSIDYPMEVSLDLPNALSAFDPIDVAIDEFSIKGAKIETKSLGFEDLNLDLFAQSDGVSFTDISLFNTAFGSAFDLPDFVFDGFDKTDLRLLSIADTAIVSSPIDGVAVIAGTPGGRAGVKTQDPVGAKGELVPLKAEIRENLIKADVDPLQLFASKLPGPVAAAIDALSEDFSATFEGFGTSIEAKLKYTIVSPFVSAGFDVVQTFEFRPTEVETTIDVEGTSVDGGLDKVFEFSGLSDDDAALADGEINGTATFDLQGQLVSSISLVPKGAIGIKILAAAGSLTFGAKPPGSKLKAKNVGLVIPPLFNERLEADIEAFSVKIVDDKIVDLPDDFFNPISIDFEIPVVDAGPPALLNRPEEIIVRDDVVNAFGLNGAILVDTDTGGPLILTLRVGSGTLSGTSAGGVNVSGSGSRALTLTGTQEDLTAFLSGRNLGFEPGSGNTTLSLVGDDQQGNADTDLGSVTLRVIEGIDEEAEERTGGTAGDRFDAFDLDGDGRRDTDGGETPVAFNGGGGDDTLIGSIKNDLLIGGAGNDGISANGGDDTVIGGSGNDQIDGFVGDDSIEGGAGDDSISDSFGTNTLIGGIGNDSITSSVAVGDVGGQLIIGGDGDDTLTAIRGEDTIIGGEGNDVIISDGLADFNDGSADLVLGDGGDDFIRGGRGEDTLFGGEGDDTIFSNSEAVLINAGAGNDSVNIFEDDFERRETFVPTVTEVILGAGNDFFRGQLNVEHATGGPGNDTLAGQEGDETLDGGVGDDSIDGARAFTEAGSGADTLIGGAGNDTIRADDGDVVDAGDDDDTVSVARGSEVPSIITGAGNDRINASPTTRSIDAGDGDDIIEIDVEGKEDAETRRLTIDAGAGDDSVDAFGRARSFASEFVGADIFGGAGNDTLEGTPNDDLLEDLAGDNVIRSLGADTGDTIRTGSGDDSIDAGGGDDLIQSGAGDDTIRTSSGADTVRSGDGDDEVDISNLFDDEGPSRIFTGSGNDTISALGIGDRPEIADTVAGGLGDDNFERLGFGKTLFGGDGVDALLTGTEISGFVRSLTIDLGKGEMIDSTDPTRKTALDSIELVELTRRTIFAQNVDEIAGTTPQIDKALSLIEPGTVALPAALDVVIGSNADETLASGNRAFARLEGKGGDDFLIGFQAGETSGGGFSFATFLDGGDGIDTLFGGAGNDTLVADSEDALADGRFGRDLLTFASQPARGQLLVDLSDPDAQLAVREDEGFIISGIEDLEGRNGARDILIGNDDTRLLRGLGGNDALGLTTLLGGTLVDGGAGDDTLTVDTDRSVVIRLTPVENPDDPGGAPFEGGAFFENPLFGGTVELRGIENAVGGNQDDDLEGNNAANFLSGEGLNDRIAGGGGNDTLAGGDGRDTIIGGAGNDDILGGAGNDSLTGGAGADVFSVFGEFGVDIITDFDPLVDRLDVAFDRRSDLVFETISIGTRVSLAGEAGAVILRGVDLAPVEAAVRRLDLGIAPDNAAPDARDDAFEVAFDSRLDGDVFANNGAGRDRDADEDPFTVSDVAGGAVGRFVALESGARVRIAEDGTLRYDPNGAFDGLGFDETTVDTFTYTIDDGLATDSATVSVTVSGPAGPTRGDDDLAGGAADDAIDALNGNDTVSGGGGNDTLTGGNGNDRLSGDNGNDRLIGSGGSDGIDGGNGSDVLIGGGGSDTLSGGSGGDTLSGGGGGDDLGGGTGSDSLTGGGGGDDLAGGGGNDSLNGGNGSDAVSGGGGSDVVTGGGGNDTLSGGKGNDTLNGGKGRDEIDGGSGADVIRFGPGDGQDIVTGFEDGRDRLELDAGLLGDASNAAQVLRQFASDTADGVLLDFGREEILFPDLPDVNTLRGDIDIV